MNKKILTAFFLLVLVAMLWVTVTASQDRDVLTAAAEIWADPWGKATLFDAYFAFLTIYIWVYYRETSVASRCLWFVLFMTLGNFAIAAYCLKVIWRGEKWLPQEV